MQNTIVQYCYMPSPVGQLLLAGSNNTLATIRFANQDAPKANWQHAADAFIEATTQLQEYFEGKRRTFDIRYKLAASPFQREVLQYVAQIPFALTASYSEIAQLINKPAAVRAVGGANANNPLPIIIPCHRVVGKNGSLTGFAGGLAIKSYLLNLEKSQIAIL